MMPGAGARVNMIPCNPGPTDPQTGLCRFNPLTQQEVQPEIERFNVFGRGTLQFAPSLTGYLELSYFSTKTIANGTLGANNDSGVFTPGDPVNPLIVHGPMILPASHPDNTFGVDRTLFYRPYELAGRDQTTDNEVFRGLVGLKGRPLAGTTTPACSISRASWRTTTRLHHLGPDAGGAEQRHLPHHSPQSDAPSPTTPACWPRFRRRSATSRPARLLRST